MCCLQVLVPYIDQQTALSLRLTCTTAASVCAAAVQELTYVLGTAAAASRCEDAAMHLALGFRAALGTFSSSNTLRLFCVLRRPADPAEASALFDALQHQGPGVAAAAVQATQTQQQQNAQEHVQDQQAGSSPLTGLRGLTLSEIKGQGSLQHSPVAAGMGVGAVLPYLPLLSAQLRSLHVKCLRAPSNISTVLPRLEHLTSLSLDSTSGFEPKVWKAVGQLRQLRQLSVVVEATPNLFLDWGRAETSAGLEHLVGLTELSLLKLTVVSTLIKHSSQLAEHACLPGCACQVKVQTFYNAQDASMFLQVRFGDCRGRHRFCKQGACITNCSASKALAA